MSERPASGKRTFLFEALQLGGLWALAVAQPIYDLIARDAAFLSAARLDRAGLLALVATCSAAIPAALYLLIAAVGLGGEKRRRGFLAATLALLTATLILQSFSKVSLVGPWVVTGAALVIAAALGVLFERSAITRSFVSILGCATVIVPALFLTSPGPRSVLLPAAPHGRPVEIAPVPLVLVVFDELPSHALIDENLDLRNDLFSTFGAFAAQAHWFRQTTTVAAHTNLAIPALLSGRYPPAERAAAPNLSTFPDNLFTLVAETHDIQARQQVSDLVPPRAKRPASESDGSATRLAADLVAVWLHRVLPTGWRGALPQVDSTWGGFWRAPGIFGA
ncbi:MAG: hypothetical protein VYE73_02815 [Acidobacteriota bacterium]|nr:hypothetical protein [Acidobacteriota bacterium]